MIQIFINERLVTIVVDGDNVTPMPINMGLAFPHATLRENDGTRIAELVWEGPENEAQG